MIRLALALALALIAAAPGAADNIKDLDPKWMKAMKDATLRPSYAAPLKGSKAIGQYYADFLSKFRVKDVRMTDAGSETHRQSASVSGR
jgi:hypothetical protein